MQTTILFSETRPALAHALLSERPLEDIPEGFQSYDFSFFICGTLLHCSCGLNKLKRLVIGDRSYSHKLPSFKPGVVQKNNEFSRVEVACKDFVFPLLHDNQYGWRQNRYSPRTDPVLFERSVRAATLLPET
jgi:hypothetical protein